MGLTTSGFDCFAREKMNYNNYNKQLGTLVTHLLTVFQKYLNSVKPYLCIIKLLYSFAKMRWCFSNNPLLAQIIRTEIDPCCQTRHS